MIHTEDVQAAPTLAVDLRPTHSLTLLNVEQMRRDECVITSAVPIELHFGPSCVAPAIGSRANNQGRASNLQHSEVFAGDRHSKSPAPSHLHRRNSPETSPAMQALLRDSALSRDFVAVVERFEFDGPRSSARSASPAPGSTGSPITCTSSR
jgi:hypothetical protein